LGYWKHPPLPWLLPDIIRRIFDSRLWPFFLLGQLAAAVACWATWRLGRELFTPPNDNSINAEAVRVVDAGNQRVVAHISLGANPTAVTLSDGCGPVTDDTPRLK
jgi:hypothetical protein